MDNDNDKPVDCPKCAKNGHQEYSFKNGAIVCACCGKTLNR